MHVTDANNIRYLEDHQHNHPDNKLPILDLKVWVVEDERGDQRLHWQYYGKPMENWLLIPADSAMSLATKRTSLTDTIWAEDTQKHLT